MLIAEGLRNRLEYLGVEAAIPVKDQAADARNISAGPVGLIQKKKPELLPFMDVCRASLITKE